MRRRNYTVEDHSRAFKRHRDARVDNTDPEADGYHEALETWHWTVQNNVKWGGYADLREISRSLARQVERFANGTQSPGGVSLKRWRRGRVKGGRRALAELWAGKHGHPRVDRPEPGSVHEGRDAASIADEFDERHRPNPPTLNAAFRRWFGRSVVCKKDGHPKIVYHGTRSPVDFEAFAAGAQWTDAGEWVVMSARDPGSYLGPHFTESRKLASRFALGQAAEWDRRRIAGRDPPAGRVIPVFLAIEQPKVFRSDEEMYEWILKHGYSSEIDLEIESNQEPNEEGELPELGDEELLEAKREALDRMQGYDSFDEGPDVYETAIEELGTSARNELLRQGYDGVRYRNTIEGGGWSWIAFEAGQIKSALANDGTWDRSDPNITS